MRPASAKPRAGTKPERFLIVNADDLGMSPGVTRGILGAYDRGLVTSASLMVDRPSAAEAIRGARDRPGLGLGLHLDLGSWELRDGSWVQAARPVDLSDPVAVEKEIRRQVTLFVDRVGASPTHLDSHQHLHLGPEARPFVTEWARRLSVPLRGVSPGISTCGDFYGQDGRGGSHHDWISVAALARILNALETGVTELCCHPGLGSDAPDGYRIERELEFRTLTSQDLAALVAESGIQLRNFATIPQEADHVSTYAT